MLRVQGARVRAYASLCRARLAAPTAAPRGLCGRLVHCSAKRGIRALASVSHRVTDDWRHEFAPECPGVAPRVNSYGTVQYPVARHARQLHTRAGAAWADNAPSRATGTVTDGGAGDDDTSFRTPPPDCPPSRTARLLTALHARMPKRGSKSAAKGEEATDEGSGGASSAAPVDAVGVARLLHLARAEAKPLTLAVGSLVLTTGVSLVFPAAVGQILDSALGEAAIFTPTQVALGLLGLFTVQAGLIVGRGVLLQLAGERIAARLRTSVFSSMLDQEIGFWDAQSTGNMINRLSADVLMVQQSLTSNIVSALRNSFMVTGGTVLVFAISPKLAMVSIGMIPPVALAGITYSRYIKKRQHKVQEALGKTMEVAESVVSSIRTVRQFAQEDTEKQRFKERVGDAYQMARKVAIASATFDGTIHMATNICLVSVLGYGGSLVLDGALTAGQLTSFLMYSLYAGINLASLSENLSKLFQAVGASTRVFEILDRRPGMPVAGGDTIPDFAGRISFRDVTFAYPQRQADDVLQGFNLDLEPGKMTALVGESGSGKSTVAALMTRLYDVSGGSLEFDGRPIGDLDPRWVRRTIGIVPQEPVMFSMSVADNIRYGAPHATQEEVVAAAKLANAHEFITALPGGYDCQVGERGVLLSGGQKQRCAIARAVIKDPKVLVLDEATSALDARSEKAVQEALERASAGRTVLTIAHRLSTMASADEVAVLKGGRVVQQGPYKSLLADDDGAFSKLVKQQLRTEPTAIDL